jgi:hypothetical protein
MSQLRGFKGKPRSFHEESRFYVGLRRVGLGYPESAFLTTKNAKYREIGGIGIQVVRLRNFAPFAVNWLGGFELVAWFRR